MEQIGPSRDCDLREYDLASDRSALELWRVLSDQRNMGPITVSKLMAAKRPHLIPIYDSYVAAALLPGDARQRWEWWGPWQELLQGPDGDDVVIAVEALRDAAAERGAEVGSLTVPRIIDIVIWRAEERQRRERVG